MHGTESQFPPVMADRYYIGAVVFYAGFPISDRQIGQIGLTDYILSKFQSLEDKDKPRDLG